MASLIALVLFLSSVCAFPYSFNPWAGRQRFSLNHLQPMTTSIPNPMISGFAGGNVLCAYCQRVRGPCGCQGLCVGGCGGGFGGFGSSLGPAFGSSFSPAFGPSFGSVRRGGQGFPFLSYGAFPQSRFSQFGGRRSAGVSLGSRFLSRNFQGGGGNMNMFGNSADYDHDD
ncbi:keratin, type I cytoskeletal 10-like [Crassostrea angulata]|uniref:keratin, type I cytoskeletal 10-like n=1 Tax=Magallana angulata TaxID=2784310 RepID=UPI0022B0A036|nr:keratin, type I cytoskeletal 10-like [Crassostrea angulata]